jgi:hypothetical protein
MHHDRAMERSAITTAAGTAGIVDARPTGRLLPRPARRSATTALRWRSAAELLAILLIPVAGGLVMADRAAGGRAKQPVMARKMPDHATNQGALDATRLRRGCTRDPKANDQSCNRSLHVDSPKNIRTKL